MKDLERKILNRIAETDPKPIGNIILNLCGCEFCEAFNIDNCPEDKSSCTDYIDDFIRNFYSN